MCYRAWLFARYRLNRSVRRVPVSDVEARVKLEGAPDIIIADVRSHGYYDEGEQRVQGSIRIREAKQFGCIHRNAAQGHAHLSLLHLTTRSH